MCCCFGQKYSIFTPLHILMKKEKNEAWYASWFDTPYYHILYKDRDYEEAALFMQNITHYLKLSPNATILDVACGRGRHSKYLNKLGFQVTGIDLSPSSIAYASQFKNDTLTFKVQDMCEPLPQRFDAVFNLFTSFGYFEEEQQNIKALAAFKKQLSTKGYGVLDFLNVGYVKEHLVPEEVKEVEGIKFTIKRRFTDKYIIKDISFEDSGNSFSFSEKVKAITLDDFKFFFKETNITLIDTFGDYKLNPFDVQKTQRLILVFK